MSNENEQKPWERAANELGLLSRTPASQWPNFPVQDTIQRACQEWADHSTASLRAECERLRGEAKDARDLLSQYEDDTATDAEAIRFLCRPFLGADAVDGETDEAPSPVTVVEKLVSKLTAAKSQVEALRAALQRIADQWSTVDEGSIKEWENAGTEAFDDPLYMNASAKKPLIEMAKNGLLAASTEPPATELK